MTITDDILIQKITGFLEPFRDAKPKDLMHGASLELVDDYRNTRKLFLQLYPDYEPVAPPDVVVKDDGQMIVATIGEVVGFSGQLLNFLHNLTMARQGPITLD